MPEKRPYRVDVLAGDSVLGRPYNAADPNATVRRALDQFEALHHASRAVLRLNGARYAVVHRGHGRTVRLELVAAEEDRVLFAHAQQLRHALVEGVAAYVNGPVWRLAAEREVA